MVITLNHVQKHYKERCVVSDLSFEVKQGEIFGLLGPNGAGKTTTIHMMLGLVTPSAGTIHILGMDIATKRYDILSRVNFSSAYTSLPSNLTVAENLHIFARLYGLRKAQAKISALVERFGLGAELKKVAAVLSSGQRTRLNLCKALLNDPEVLFLDEPTASLDPDVAETVRSTIREIRREKQVSIVYTSHNMREVEELCDRVIFLARGKVVAQGTPQEIVDRSSQQSLEQVFISIARDGALKDVQQAGSDTCG